MAITELLDRVSFSPVPGGDGAPPSPESLTGGPEPTVEIELPSADQVGGLDPVVLPPAFAPVVEVIEGDAPNAPGPDAEEISEAPAQTSAEVETAPLAEPAADAEAPGAAPPDDEAGAAPNTAEDLPSSERPATGFTPPPPASWTHRIQSLPPLPSWGIAVVGGLSLLCLSLAAALAIAVAEPTPVEAIPLTTDTPAVPPGAGTLPDPAPSEATPEPEVSPASFTAEPTAIPVELLTRLEQASDEALDVELARLLEAMQFGFGRRSTQLEPTLRSYVYRMGSRFEWNPDTFRVAVTAPDPALATARAALLERLFEDAVAAGRLDVGTGVGPNAITLVTE